MLKPRPVAALLLALFALTTAACGTCAPPDDPKGLFGGGVLNPPGGGPVGMGNLTGGTTATVADDSITVWIVGQSNSLPQALTSAITNRFGFGTTYSAVQFVRRGAPSPADPPVFTDEGPQSLQPDGTGQIGIETSMLRRLDGVYPNGVTGIIGPSIGGAGLHDRFRVDVVYPTVGPNLHTQVVAYPATVPTMGAPDVLVLMECETDASDATDAAAVEVDLTNQITSIRATHGNIPVILGELGTTHSTYTQLSVVRAAFVAVAAALSSVYIVDTDDLPLNGPNHYTADSDMILGERIADQILTAIGKPRVRWTSTAVNRAVQFTYTGTGATPVSYAWDFGDGSTSTSQNPSHTYASNGRYAVTLTATGATGKSHTRIQDRVAVDPTGRWTVDATSKKARPANSTEEANLVADASLAIGAADHIYLLQESSGNALDSKGSKPLTVANSPSRQQTVSGWSTFFYTASGAATTQSAVNATLPNANAARVAAMTYATWNASGSTNRAIFNRGTASIAEMQSSGGTSKARIRHGTPANATINDHAGTVYPYLIFQDPNGGGRIFLATPHEIVDRQGLVEISWTTQSGSEFRLTFSLAADTSANNKHNFAKVWDAIPSITMDEDEIRATFEAHGWDVEW